jgi:uncharacterized membrane protein YuzA (DUF378 family)
MPASFMQHFIVFVLAVFIGFQVIWNVSHALHTPLMAVTNAISSIIILGALMQIGSTQRPDHPAGRRGHLHGRHQHLRRLPRHTAHARHVPEILGGRGNGRRIHDCGLCGRGLSCSSSVLGGLSGQESAKRAVWYGIVGMASRSRHADRARFGPVADVAGADRRPGAAVGYQLATRVQMTQMPELVAIMHSLVGLAAVFVGFNAHHDQLCRRRLRGAGPCAGRGRRGRDYRLGLPREVHDGLSAFGS